MAATAAAIMGTSALLLVAGDVGWGWNERTFTVPSQTNAVLALSTVGPEGYCPIHCKFWTADALNWSKVQRVMVAFGKETSQFVIKFVSTIYKAALIRHMCNMA